VPKRRLAGYYWIVAGEGKAPEPGLFIPALNQWATIGSASFLKEADLVEVGKPILRLIKGGKK
jgi:hypothetical protein